MFQKPFISTCLLRAAYHYKAKLEGQAINTKDADLVVHPAGHVDSCRAMTEKLRALGWRNTEDCYPQSEDVPADEQRAIRLFPPNSNEYFIEFLNIPDKDQVKAKDWILLRLPDGCYGLPSFRFLGIVSIDRMTSKVGLEYAQGLQKSSSFVQGDGDEVREADANPS